MKTSKRISLLLSACSLLTILYSAIIFPACKKSPPAGIIVHDTVHVVKYDTIKLTCDTTVYSYSGAVSYIMNANCATVGCHNTAGAVYSGGYDLSNYAGVDTAVKRGRLLGCINQIKGFSAMPKAGGMLPPCEITVIKKWVNAGAPNN
jgi:hypothetical protein